MARISEGNIILNNQESIVIDTITTISNNRKGLFNTIVCDSSPGVEIVGFSADVNLTNSSNQHLPTEGAVKSYIDNSTIMVLGADNNTAQSGIKFYNLLAGEAIPQWSLIYKKKNQSNNDRYFAYAAGGADKNLLPLGMSMNSASGDGDLINLISGVFFLRTSVYAQSFTQSVKVYASTVPGQITIAPPTLPGDKVLIVGHLWGSDRFLMSLPVMIDVEIPV